MRSLAWIILGGALILGDGSWMQPDTLSPNQYQIFDETGERKGRAQRDTLQPYKYQVFDKDGGLVGEIFRDTLQPYKWRFQDPYKEFGE